MKYRLCVAITPAQVPRVLCPSLLRNAMIVARRMNATRSCHWLQGRKRRMTHGWGRACEGCRPSCIDGDRVAQGAVVVVVVEEEELRRWKKLSKGQQEQEHLASSEWTLMT